MALDYKAIGMRVKSARIRKGMTQDEVAEKAEISNSHISNVETGNTKVSLPPLVLIANAIGVSVDELLCDSVEKSKRVFDDALSRIAKDCDDWETRIIADVAAALKESLRKTAR